MPAARIERAKKSLQTPTPGRDLTQEEGDFTIEGNTQQPLGGSMPPRPPGTASTPKQPTHKPGRPTAKKPVTNKPARPAKKRAAVKKSARTGRTAR